MAAGPGQKIDGDGTAGAPTTKEVQKVLDAKPAVFRGFSQALASAMDQIVAATQKKDAKTLAEVSGNLDQICEDCHKIFWYPNQK